MEWLLIFLLLVLTGGQIWCIYQFLRAVSLLKPQVDRIIGTVNKAETFFERLEKKYGEYLK